MPVQSVGSSRSSASVGGRLPPLRNGEDIRNRPDILKMMIDKAKAAGIPPELIFMTIGVETTFRQHHSGDRDSVGLYQQRPSQGWGSVEQCIDPEHATDKFIQAAKEALGKKGPFSTDAASLGRWAQATQRSAYPDKYQHLYGEAQRIIKAVGEGVTPGGKDMIMPDGASQTGGGGGGAGSASSSSNGSNRYSYGYSDTSKPLTSLSPSPADFTTQMLLDWVEGNLKRQKAEVVQSILGNVGSDPDYKKWLANNGKSDSDQSRKEFIAHELGQQAVPGLGQEGLSQTGDQLLASYSDVKASTDAGGAGGGAGAPADQGASLRYNAPVAG